MFDNLPLWATIAGLAVSLLIIAGVSWKAMYAATLFMVKRLQDNEELPEMQEIKTLQAQVNGMEATVGRTETVVFELEHTVKNGLSTKAEESREWQEQYGPKIDQLIGAVNEHLRQSNR